MLAGRSWTNPRKDTCALESRFADNFVKPFGVLLGFVLSDCEEW